MTQMIKGKNTRKNCLKIGMISIRGVSELRLEKRGKKGGEIKVVKVAKRKRTRVRIVVGIGRRVIIRGALFIR